MSDFWTPGMSASTSIAFSFCSSKPLGHLRAPHRVASPKEGFAAPVQMHMQRTARPTILSCCTVSQVALQVPVGSRMVCRPPVSCCRHHGTYARMFWMHPGEASRRIRAATKVYRAARKGDRAHLDDVDGDAALRRHAGRRPAELPVEVEHGREEQVV